MRNLAWKVYLEKFPFECIGLASGDTGGLPPASRTHVPRPLSRVHHAGTDPPLTDFPRGERLENTLRRCGDLYGGFDCSFREVDNSSHFAILKAIHFDLQEAQSSQEIYGMKCLFP